ncbi:hypothetical protein [Actinomadura rupiterrae]|uniref:hypothetical protein n=1 Tax=Actinomadura rupiterrae TaxID=559627 RepID=UPI0020A4205A|nr:hypothetical protein [Actinomadura rupiterrae]MCP2342973.1 tetratricopeptide (TPR) repeat protein [Actinomadura rupiterrae]
MKAAFPKELRQTAIRSLAHQIVWDWEAGNHKPRVDYRMYLARVHNVEEGPLFEDGTIVPVSRRALLGAAGAAVGLSVVGGLPWLASAEPIGASTNVGTAEIELLQKSAQDLIEMDQRFGADRLWWLGRGQLAYVLRLIDLGNYDDAIEQQLHSLAGDFTSTLGWFSYDAGLHDEARVYFSEALNRATITQNDWLAMRTLSNMARQAVDLGKGREAVKFSTSALKKAKENHASSRAWALLFMREAQGHAKLGKTDPCNDALRRAHQAYSRGPRDHDPDWTEFLNDPEMATLEGMCRTDLAQHRQAISLLERACAERDEAHSRNRGMGLGRLAFAAARHGELDRACDATGRALALVEGGMSSARARAQIRAVGAALDPYRSMPEVRDTTERIRALTA